MDFDPNEIIYTKKDMKSLAPQRHGQSAWKVVSNEEDKKLILVVFIVPDSMETGQWVRLEIHVADKKQNLAADQSHVSCTWWRHY